MEDLEAARDDAINARTEKEQLQKKCDYFNEQLTKTRIQNQQALDLIANRNEGALEKKGKTYIFIMIYRYKQYF